MYYMHMHMSVFSAVAAAVDPADTASGEDGCSVSECIYIFTTPQQSSMRIVWVFRSLTKKCTVMIIMHFDLHKRTLKIVVSCTYGAYLYEVSTLAGALLLFRSKM